MRHQALESICARRKRSWMVQPEARVNIFRRALDRAFRVSVSRGEITRDGTIVGSACPCGCGKPVPAEAVRA